jgi:hypothetical protein
VNAPGPTLKSALEGANRAILAEASAHPEDKGMGTTCTAAVFGLDHLSLAQVGDSRAYMLRDGRLELLTRDQTMASELVEAGVLRPDQVEHFPYRHVLVQALGTAGRVQPVITDVPLREGDRVDPQRVPRSRRRRAGAHRGRAGLGRARQRHGRRGRLWPPRGAVLKRLRLDLAVLALGALGFVACGARGGAPPLRDQAAEKPPWDAGLPIPPAASRRGVIVPSDVGLGAGPAGPTSNSQTSPPLSPAPTSATGQ